MGLRQLDRCEAHSKFHRVNAPSLGSVSKREPNALESGRQGRFNASWLPEASAYGSLDGHFWSFETGPSVERQPKSQVVHYGRWTGRLR